MLTSLFLSTITNWVLLFSRHSSESECLQINILVKTWYKYDYTVQVLTLTRHLTVLGESYHLLTGIGYHFHSLHNPPSNRVWTAMKRHFGYRISRIRATIRDTRCTSVPHLLHTFHIHNQIQYQNQSQHE